MEFVISIAIPAAATRSPRRSSATRTTAWCCNACGWKGKAIYTSLSTRAPFHGEGGKGETSKLVKFQIRPSVLAK